MISVGNRNEIGLGIGRGMMESETELEEGEACFCDSTMDPDVSLSYLGEKVHNLLGHFQKDFEGEVSAENLGSRFGGYGSFLPTYQRSPSWPEPNNCNRQTSTNDLLPEGGRQTSLGSSCTPLSGRPIASSARSSALPVRAPSIKAEINSAAPPTQVDSSISKSKKVKKPTKASDLKTLKVRIKVGTNNLPTRKNAEIYSGLGLDDSPSSSLDGSPMGSEGVSRDLQVYPDESPTSILQIMTSHPMHDILLLSPLSDELIGLTEKEKLRGKHGYEGKKKAGLETSNSYPNGEASDTSNLRICNKDASAKGKGNDKQNGSRVLSKKEMEADAPACDKLVFKALKLPLLSSASPPKVAEKTVDGSRSTTKGRTKEASFDRTSKKCSLPIIATETNSIEGSVVSSRITTEIKGTYHNDPNSGYVKKGDDYGEEKAYAVGPLNQKSSSKNEDGMKLDPEKERDTGKSNGTECHNAQSSFIADSSLEFKVKKTSSSRSDSENVKKNLARDKYKEFFGDIEHEPEDTGLGEIHSKEVLKGSDAISKKKLERNSLMKGRVNDTKCEKQFASVPSNGAPHNPDGVPGAAAPLVKEDWVCCDKCQTWRILPLGTNPNSLPDKWVCSMQTWLPGMNRCGISEEITTKTLRALCQVPTTGATASASDNMQHSQLEYPGEALAIDTFHAGQDHQKVVLQARDAGGKKIYGSKVVSSATKQEGALSANSIKRNHQGTLNSRSSNDTTRSPAEENGHQLVSLPSSSNTEKHRDKQKEKRRSHSDGGIKNSADMDGSCAKKLKRDDGPIGAKPGQSTSTGLSNSGSEMDRDKGECKNVKADSLKKLASEKNPDNHTLEGSAHKCDSKGSLKKRKRSESEAHTPSSRSRASGETEGRGRGKKEGRNSADSSKRDLSTAAAAATSSSSKVSCSHKNGAPLHELKGSPVESVSSSPLRIRNTDTFSTKKNTKRKDDRRNASSSTPLDVTADPLGQATHNSDQDLDDAKDEKVSLSQHKEKNRTVRSNSEKCKTKETSGSLDEVKLTSGRSKLQGKSGAGSDRLHQGSNENVKGDVRAKFGNHDGAHGRLDDKKQVALTDRDDGKLFRKLTCDKAEPVERGKSNLSSPPTRGQNEPVPAFKREATPNMNVLEGEMLNASRQPGSSLRHSTPSAAHKVRGSSPIRKESSSQAAANAIKEATELKHVADRRKSSGASLSESTSLYFQAILKFLHGASLVKSCSDTARQIYTSTASLCEFVAHEYEKLKDMAGVALVYKCMEVAYMQVIYSSNFNANRYRNELQTALQIFPPGESPSSSASDVDNLNNPAIVDKVALVKSVGSPQVAATNVVSARSRSTVMRLLAFAEAVNLAMEASRKSRAAFAQCKEPILSVKKALDFNFQDVDGLLRLMRVAVEEISPISR